MKPTQNGYYWMWREGEAPVVVNVYHFEWDLPTVAFPGTANDRALQVVDGEWSGPLVSPWEGEGEVK